MNSFRENNSVSKKFFSIFFKIIGAIWIALSISVLWDKFSSTNFDFVTVISTLIIGITIGYLSYTESTNGLPTPEGSEYGIVYLSQTDVIEKQIADMR
ncbi:MAG TPA: hypothetical protein H9671_02945, partial [Firmicutes bacterium]|nr:hypothetical protein [Bacillota bacterium]